MSVSEQEETEFTQCERRMTLKNEVREIMSVSEQEETEFTQCERRMTLKNEVREIKSVSEQEETMKFTKLEDYLKKLDTEYGIPMGDLRIMRAHREIYRYRFGYADVAKTVALREDHLFRLYSCTKVITMIAVMQQIEQGKLDFDDILSQYIPEYADVRGPEGEPVKQPIRIQDLMTMTAGLSYDVNDAHILAAVKASGRTATTRELIGALAQSNLLYEPATHWHYSLAHDVLAAVVEVTSGERFYDYIRKHIFAPLGVQDLYMHFEYDGEMKKRLCDIYEAKEETFVLADDSHANSYVFTPNYDSGGAGLGGTVSAYSVIMDALACGGVGEDGNRILKEETVALFRQPYTTEEPLSSDFGEFNKQGYEYGYGVRVMVKEGLGSPLGEFGWDGAAGAYALVDTKHQISITYAQHILNYGRVYDEIHPKIRELAYACLANEQE